MTAENRRAASWARYAGSGAAAGRWKRLSPFTSVHCEGDTATVEFEGGRWQLVSINGASTKQILDFCKNRYGALWEKRFAEDLVEVLQGMKRPVRTDDTVALVLREPKTGKLTTVDRAKMTAEKRQSVWRARNLRF